jgi:hypothetical protein
VAAPGEEPSAEALAAREAVTDEPDDTYWRISDDSMPFAINLFFSAVSPSDLHDRADFDPAVYRGRGCCRDAETEDIFIAAGSRGGTRKSRPGE